MNTKVLFLLFLVVFGFLAYSKHIQHERAIRAEVELNNTLNLVQTDLETFKLSYNSTHWAYLNQKVDDEDVGRAIERVLELREMLLKLNVSDDEIGDIDACLNRTYSYQRRAQFYAALTEGRSCAVLAADYLGSTLALANRTEFLKYVRGQFRSVEALQNKTAEKWKQTLGSGINFTDYLITGFVVEDNIIKAEISLNQSRNFLEKLDRIPNPTTSQEIENVSILGSWVTSYLEFARGFLMDSTVLISHVTPGTFNPSGQRTNVHALVDNLSGVDVPCEFEETMLKVACDWKEYHKKWGLLGVENGYYSAATYHLLYAIAIDGHLDEFEALNSTFAALRTPTEKVRMVLRLRHEALESINDCSQDPLTSLYIQDAVGWYFKHGDAALEMMVRLRTDDPTAQPLYNYEMAKIIAKNMCPYVVMLSQTTER
ncbi:1-deoxy-D-xylulose-5-phosphate synthase [Thermococcus sp. ES12]|uniref:1-deoxy-D-xylulose-5-phosphate synthase n=1 Tax=Thermococcus sp. ES12 TaxID=1638246 RepID=UPI00143229B5|nr:1-deoxy-D-xylulose-5-phosphate synthase [Thermococcus sp. ES12]NJE76579.1 1-deoxy-D-xylulose-5-phosphate synthase [Thermococcus sp. ES12]